MKMIDSILTDPARWMFHATFSRVLPLISKEGLTPNLDRDPNFDGYPVNGKVFASGSEESARFYLDAFSTQEWSGAPVMLRFPYSSAKFVRDSFGNMNDFWTNDSIPSEVIEVLRGDSWVKL